MKKSVILSAILAMGTMVHASQDWYVGVGYEGFSIKKDITNDIAVQAAYGGLGDVSGIKIRGHYKFMKERMYDVYGYGGFMYYSDSETTKVSGGYGTSAKSDVDITTKGVEFGVGVDHDLRKSMDMTLPIFISLEIGYRASNTDVDGKVTYSGYEYAPTINASADYDYSGIIGGLWFHYRF
jgi:hypothetical protein